LKPLHPGKHIIVVAGPTASGKSALASALAENFAGEIVNADSMQVYREFRILTARPAVEDEKRIRHHLYGVVSAITPWSVGGWLGQVIPIIEDMQIRRHLPIVCGGTGLYLKSLREGIAPVPDVPAGIVAQATSLYEKIGGTAFLEKLAEFDPQGASTLEPADRQRLVRAFAVFRSTGRPLSDWQSVQSSTPPLDAQFFTIHLIPPRDLLYQRIDERLARMMELGALDEIRNVRNRDFSPDLPAMKALGVSEFQRYLAGDIPMNDAIASAQQRTRNFAKRQLTWFRNQSRADLIIEDFGNEQAVAMACQAISTVLSS